MFLWPVVKRRNYLLQESTHSCIMNSHRQHLSFKSLHYIKQLKVFFTHTAALYTKKETESKANLSEHHTEGRPRDQCWVFLVQQDSMSAVGQIQSLPYKTTECHRSLEVLKFEWASLLQKYKVYCTKTTNTIQLILLDNIKTLLAIL